MPESLREFLKQALAKLGRVELTAQRAVEGTLTGRHKSPFRGFSVEFAEHRPYFPGDDLRYLDWKVLAKRDKLFVRQFEQETNMRCYLLVDTSGSMGYGGENGSKLDCAVRLAALLSYLVLRQGDAVGLALFSDRLRQFIPARRSSSHLHFLLEALEQVKAHGQTHLRRVTEELSALLKRRSLIVVLSDLVDEDGALAKALRYLYRRGHDVLVLHLLAPEELTFPFSLPSLFADMEADLRLPVEPEALREVYQRRLTAFLRECQQACGQAGAQYVRITTNTDPAYALGFYLAWRIRRGSRFNGFGRRRLGE